MNRKIKIIGALTVSLLFVMFISKFIFIDNTPKVSVNFLANLKNAPLLVWESLSSLGKSSSMKKEIALKKLRDLPDSSLNTIAQGVYAKEDATNNVVYIRVTKDVVWEEREITLDGKLTKIRFPKK